jgi:uncharacterized protein YheU (UPF0270 family)
MREVRSSLAVMNLAPDTPIVIPHRELQPETLRAMLEDFVTRDGTDYGEQECTLEARVSQVLGQLNSGKVAIVYAPDTESFSILPGDQLLKSGLTSTL